MLDEVLDSLPRPGARHLVTAEVPTAEVPHLVKHDKSAESGPKQAPGWREAASRAFAASAVAGGAFRGVEAPRGYLGSVSRTEKLYPTETGFPW